MLIEVDALLSCDVPTTAAECFIIIFLQSKGCVLWAAVCAAALASPKYGSRVPGGVEMYVAKHRDYVVKRMPDTGHLHHPSGPSYEPDSALTGLGALLREAVIEPAPDKIDLRVSFPMVRCSGRSASTDWR
jgi:hypothetical protein